MRLYPHMCRMDHIEIGHFDSEHEQCPLCRTIATLDAAREYLESDVADGFRPAQRLTDQIDRVLRDVGSPASKGGTVSEASGDRNS